MVRLIDTQTKNGTTTKIGFDGHGKDRKMVVKTEQDIDPLLKQNAELRTMGTVKGTDNQAHMRVIADIPQAIYLSWYRIYGFDINSPQNSNWGMGMTAREHSKFLRSLLNANPALKTVDESL